MFQLRRYSVWFLILILLSWAVPSSAQESQPTVVRIDIEGLARLPETSIRAKLRTRKGLPLDRSLVSEDIKRIYALGAFGDVQVGVKNVPGGVALLFYLDELPVIHSIRFSGNDSIPMDDLQKVLDIQPMAIADDQAIQSNAKKLKEYYVDEGYFLSRVKAVQRLRKDNSVELVYLIHEGAEIMVKSIHLLGNRAIPDKEIKRILRTQEGDYLSFISKSGQFKKEQLAIVGGGDSACEEAVYLTKYGSHVHLIVRSNSLKASAAMASRVLANSMITVHWQKEVVDVEGSEWLERLIIKKVKTGEQSFLDVRGLFYAIGHTPNTDFLQGQLDLTSLGYLSTKAGRPETSIAGVFAAGDVADSEWRQGITAAGSGCQAALAAEKWLSENNLSQLIERDQLEPSEIKEESNIYVTKESEYKENAIWQKGNYVLRRLYHESNRPLLVIYTSKSCGPCHVLKPQLKRILKEFEGKVQGVEIDIEDDQDIAIQAGVNGTPLVQLFKSKVLQAQWKGVKPKSQFKNEIINLLSNDSE